MDGGLTWADANATLFPIQSAHPARRLLRTEYVVGPVKAKELREGERVGGLADCGLRAAGGGPLWVLPLHSVSSILQLLLDHRLLRSTTNTSSRRHQ